MALAPDFLRAGWDALKAKGKADLVWNCLAYLKERTGARFSENVVKKAIKTLSCEDGYDTK